MNVKTFEKRKQCAKYRTLEKFVSESNPRHLILHQAIQMMVGEMIAKTNYDKILNKLSHYLAEEYGKCEYSFVWQKDVHVKQDVIRFKRFLDWITLNEMELEKGFVATGVPVDKELADGSGVLEGMVDLILKDKKGKYGAFIISSGNSSLSLKGRSISTNAAYALEPMIAKISLEQTYPGITVCMVYLSHANDTETETSTEMVINDTAKSNVHFISYKNFYEDKVFNRGAFMEMLDKVISAPVELNCSDCRCFRLCKTDSLDFSNDKTNVSEDAGYGYRMPQFTPAQMEVVTHVDGPMRVCAGPGSGKTSVLVGRIKYLIEEKGIMPEFILAVTFTNEAARELRQRCLSFLTDDNLPKIATLNGFCYSILRENRHHLDRPLNVLTTSARLELIKSILSVFPPLNGFKNGVEDGKYSIYKTVAGRIDALKKLGKDAFFSKYPDCGADFLSFVEQYDIAIEQNGYITFDEQISLTNELFATYPDVLDTYSSIYQYIMVDEYQDVNEEQVKMLYSLARKFRNLVIVGDDDQGIYGFRGGNSSFMINFPLDFPEAKTVVFRENFRSTKALVESAKNLIRNNKERIDKDICSECVKSDKNMLPVAVPSLNVDVLKSIIEGLAEEGYHYSDICVLSTKNAPLEELHDVLPLPTVLAKSYLRNDGFFSLLHSILILHKEDNDSAFYQYMKLYDLAEELECEKGKSLMCTLLNKCGLSSLDDIGKGCLKTGIYSMALSHLYTYLLVIEGASSVSELIDNVQVISEWNKSDSPQVLMEECEKAGIREFDGLLSYCNTLVRYEDERRVEINRGERVLLMTSHDSKGKEFPVIIIRNDFSGDNIEEVRRLFYVAITRAKEQLFILQDSSSQIDLVAEMPHIVMEV